MRYSRPTILMSLFNEATPSLRYFPHQRLSRHWLLIRRTNLQSRTTQRANHSLERTRPARRDNLNGSWPGRSARGRWAARTSHLRVEEDRDDIVRAYLAEEQGLNCLHHSGLRPLMGD